MRNPVLLNLRDKREYEMLLDAVIGGKTEFTGEEKAKLLAIYTESAKMSFGFEEEALVKSVLALDVPGVNMLDKADADALAALCELYRNTDGDINKVLAAKDAALDETVSQALALALARAALDELAVYQDFANHQEDMKALSERLKRADETEFEKISLFLTFARQRTR